MLVDVYMITNLLNGKRYVGVTRVGYKARFEQHCNGIRYGTRTYISYSIEKHGRDNFKVELLRKTDELNWSRWERFYIRKYRTLHSQNGYNVTLGGDSNPMLSTLGKSNHLKAMRSAEGRKKRADAMKGRIVTAHTRNLIRINNRKNLDRITQGFKTYNNARKERVVMLDTEGNVVNEFASLSDACTYHGKSVTSSGVLKTHVDKFNLNGKRSRFWGYSWTKG